MPKTAKKKEHAAPEGWKFLFARSTPLKQVKASARADGIICTIFEGIWKEYTKDRPSRRMLKELCVAVHPQWLKTALASEEMRGQQVNAQDGSIRIYGFRVREDSAVGTSDLMVEEKQES